MPPELPEERRTRSRWTMPLATIIFIGVAAFLALTGIESREQSVAQLKTTAAKRAIPTDSVSPPEVRPSICVIDLPGRLDCYSHAALFARFSSYFAARKVAIGSRVQT